MWVPMCARVSALDESGEPLWECVMPPLLHPPSIKGDFAMTKRGDCQLPKGHVFLRQDDAQDRADELNPPYKRRCRHRGAIVPDHTRTITPLKSRAPAPPPAPAMALSGAPEEAPRQPPVKHFVQQWREAVGEWDSVRQGGRCILEREVLRYSPPCLPTPCLPARNAERRPEDLSQMSRVPDPQPPSLGSKSQVSNSQLSDPLGASQVPDPGEGMGQPCDREQGEEPMGGAESHPESQYPLEQPECQFPLEQPESQFPLAQPDPSQGSYEEPDVGSDDDSL